MLNKSLSSAQKSNLGGHAVYYEGDCDALSPGLYLANSWPSSASHYPRQAMGFLLHFACVEPGHEMKGQIFFTPYEGGFYWRTKDGTEDWSAWRAV